MKPIVLFIHCASHVGNEYIVALQKWTDFTVVNVYPDSLMEELRKIDAQQIVLIIIEIDIPIENNPCHDLFHDLYDKVSQTPVLYACHGNNIAHYADFFPDKRIRFISLGDPDDFAVDVQTFFRECTS